MSRLTQLLSIFPWLGGAQDDGSNRFGRASWWFGLVALLCWWPGWSFSARADEPEPERALASAMRLFQGGWYDRAEQAFAQFVTGFPGSTNRNQAVLLQAQSRFQMKNYQGVVELLNSWEKATGPWADECRYWLAAAQVQLDHLEPAANTYADLLKDFPQTRLRLEASYGEAMARFRLGDTARTVQLLKEPTGAFQLAAKQSTNQPVLVQGSFLLVEAMLAQKDLRGAQQVLIELPGLSPDLEWQRQYLLARIDMADRHGEEALQRVTNLVAIANSRSNVVLLARSLTLKGEILEEKQPQTAAQAFDSITLLPGIPADQKRQALLKLADLCVAQSQFTNAIQRLRDFLQQNSDDPAADLILVTLGEVYLKQYYALMASVAGTNPAPVLVAGSNLLYQARVPLEQVINQFTNSSHLGQAFLDRGWCFWEEGQLRQDSTRFLESQKSLEVAVERLPAKSVDQATARFKLGDCLFQLHDYTNALTHYRLLLDQFSEVPEAKEKLLDHALYQMVRANLELRDVASAHHALEKLMQEFPKSAWCDDALMLYGQALAEAGEYAKALQAFDDFQKQFPESALLAEVRLAVARTYSQQANWPAAIAEYSRWLTEFATNSARPQAEFDRAWSVYQSGAETNAVQLLTNLVQQYPGSPYAPVAHLWVGDYYLNQRRYGEAEKYYQYTFKSTNAVPGDLIRQAGLMAAKAAFFRTGYKDATTYLNALINDPQVGPEAWYMLGDIALEDPASTNKFDKWADAILRFERVIKFPQAGRLALLARGRIAECHYQLGALNPTRYDSATNEYWVVIQSPLADVATRSHAEVGLAQVLEKMAELRTNRTELLSQALTHYLNVVYGKRLKDGEDPDPLWLTRAALQAGALAVDRLQLYDQAERLYQDMLKAAPSLRDAWENKLASLRKQRPR